MSESSSAGGEENQLIHPIMLNAFKEMIRKNMEEEVLIGEQRERLLQSRKVDASSSLSTAVTKKETCGHDDMSKEKNNGIIVAKKNDEEGNMNDVIQSNDSMHELEESFVMVESFTSTTTSPKTARFELVEKDEHLQDGNAKQQWK